MVSFVNQHKLEDLKIISALLPAFKVSHGDDTQLVVLKNIRCEL